MKKTISMIALVAMGFAAVAGGPNANKQQSVTVDTKASTFKWHAKKVTGEHMGTVNFSSGTIQLEKGVLVGGTIEMDMTSIVTTDLQGEYKGKLEGHLKSEDFFSVEKFNKATLVIKKVEAIKGSK